MAIGRALVAVEVVGRALASRGAQGRSGRSPSASDIEVERLALVAVDAVGATLVATVCQDVAVTASGP